MSSRWKHQQDPSVQAATPERMRIEIDQKFREFLDDPDLTQYDFPNDLNNLQRKYIHEKAKKLNLQSRSHGKEPNRVLTIYKKQKLVSEKTNVEVLWAKNKTIYSLVVLCIYIKSCGILFGRWTSKASTSTSPNRPSKP